MNKKKQLPDGWRLIPLDEVCEFANGLWVGKTPPFMKAKVIRNTDFARGGTIAYDSAREIEVEARRMETKKLQQGDIIRENSGGGPKQPVGRVAFFDRSEAGDFSFGNFTTRIRAKREIVKPKWLFYALSAFYANGGTAAMENRTSGIRNLDRKMYQRIGIPTPQLNEQSHIISLLDRQMTAVEKARLAAEEKKAAAHSLPSALLREVFPYSENDKLPDGWRFVKLAEVCDILNNIRIPVKKADRVPGPYPYYGATGIVDYVDSYLFDEKLILVGEDGAKWGRGEHSAFVVEGKCWVNNHAHVLRAKNQVIPEFLAFALTDMDMLPHVTGTTVPKLNQQKLRDISVAIPPLTEQARIVSFLDRQMAAAGKARLAADEELRAINALPASLLREVFGVE